MCADEEVIVRYQWFVENDQIIITELAAVMVLVQTERNKDIYMRLRDMKYKQEKLDDLQITKEFWG